MQHTKVKIKLFKHFVNKTSFTATICHKIHVRMFILSTLLHSGNTDVKRELIWDQKTKQDSGRSQFWGSRRPTLWSAGTCPSPAGTAALGSQEAHRRPRRHPGPVLSGPHGDASDQPDPSDPQCSPTSDHWSQDARTPESWTRWKSARQRWVPVQGSLCWLRKLTENLTERKYWTLVWGEKNILDSQLVRSDRTSRCRCIPSSVCSRGTLPWSKHTGNPGNWASHTGPRIHSSLEQSCRSWSVELRTVAVELKIRTLKVLVFIEHNLQIHQRWHGCAASQATLHSWSFSFENIFYMC